VTLATSLVTTILVMWWISGTRAATRARAAAASALKSMPLIGCSHHDCATSFTEH
jgi:hypothetical protein